MIPDDIQTAVDALRLVDDYVGQVRRVQRAVRLLLDNPCAPTRYDLDFELRVLRSLSA